MDTEREADRQSTNLPNFELENLLNEKRRYRVPFWQRYWGWSKSDPPAREEHFRPIVYRASVCG